MGIIGNSPLLNRDIEVAVQVAPTDLTVLVVGESGVGKEHFPQIIHQYSSRKHGPYFAVNCGAIPEGTIDSELFGHEKGSFTDAKSERRGYFEQADGGTLFLDEVGELPLSTQVRLLRVLETGEFLKVGSSKVQKTNVRVVAATNVDFSEAIAEGRFREDLYYRLNTIEIHVPALRERKDDIPLLFRKFAADCSEKYRMPAVRLTPDAVQMLQSYYWRGNIRQLKNTAEQIAVIEMDHQISADTLRKYLPKEENQQGVVLRNPAQEQVKDYSHEIGILYNMVMQNKKDLEELKALLTHRDTEIPEFRNTEIAPARKVIQTPADDEAWENGEVIEDERPEEKPQAPVSVSLEDTNRELMREALERCGGNRKVAAAQLGISERTLYRKIKEYGL
jgi:DNA-binding NtrC family response regulator